MAAQTGGNGRADKNIQSDWAINGKWEGLTKPLRQILYGPDP